MFDIGNTLREARQRLDLSITDCESATKIRGKYLRALEREEFDQLPGATYVKGFLTTYAEFLGLDGRLVVDEYEERLTAQVQMEASQSESQRRRARRTRTREARALAAVAATVLVISLGLWAVMGPVPADSSAATPSTSTPAAPAPRETVDVSIEVIRGSGTEIQMRQNGPRGRHLSKPATLPRGEVRDITDQVPPIFLSISEGRNVNVTVNGEPQMVGTGKLRLLVDQSGTLRPWTEGTP